MRVRLATFGLVLLTMLSASGPRAQEGAVQDLSKAPDVHPSYPKGPQTTAEFDELFARVSNWGRWGKDDQIGAMNLITEAKRKQAAGLVKSGISLSLARADGAVLFTVDDDGPGVGAEEAETIFEPAVRGSAGLAAAPSAGLGLALARRLARSVSGDIHAVSSGTGGRFEIRLPAG